jgi:hypothetical protein
MISYICLVIGWTLNFHTLGWKLQFNLGLQAERSSHVCRYQDQSAKLQVQNYQLSEELDQQKSKLKDINDFLVNELKARALSFAVLQSDLAEAKKSKDQMKDSYEVCIHSHLNKAASSCYACTDE